MKSSVYPLSPSYAETKYDPALGAWLSFRRIGIASALVDHRLDAFQMLSELSRLARVAAALCLFHKGNAVPFHAEEVVQKFLFRGQ